MIRAVLDSSVLVSAFLKPSGASATLLSRAGEGAFVLCLSPAIVAETAAVLRRPRLRRDRYEPQDVSRFCELLGQVAERVEGELPQLRAVPDDPKDDVIVASAVAANAGYLVTGDRRHLLVLGRYEGVEIVSVSGFLSVLEGYGEGEGEGS
jgi:putative PIN family toxin of toxin-antitoxin system